MAITYKDAGVDVEKGERVVRNLRDIVKATWDDEIVEDVSGFLGVRDRGDRYILGATDGVGTKLLVAILAGKFSTVGQDLVAMCANDIARVGGEVLFFLNYLATGKLDEKTHFKLVEGIAQGCEIGGFPLMGGETAELPGMYQAGHFDLAGFAVGEVMKDGLVDGKNIQPGMPLLGIESSGPHSNGYSLLRKIFFERLGLEVGSYLPELNATVGEALLTPTTIYSRPILGLLEHFPDQVQGMAHITGGGMPNKLPKMLPAGIAAEVQEGSWPVHAIFEYVMRHGPVDLSEMRKTFNRGIGMVAVVKDQGAVPEMQDYLREEHGLKAYEIGRTIEKKGEEGVVYR